MRELQFGELRCGRVKVCGGCGVGNCNVGDLRCGGVAVWGVALCGSYRVGELQCGGVMVWESYGVCELLCVAVAMYSNCGLWAADYGSTLLRDVKTQSVSDKMVL